MSKEELKFRSKQKRQKLNGRGTSTQWKKSFESSSRSLFQYSKGHHKKMIGVYLGNERLRFDGFDVIPWSFLLSELYSGSIF